MPTLNLTTKSVESLKPDFSKQIDYFDSNIKGLHLRVSPKGTKNWAYFYRTTTPSGHRQRRISIGRYPEITLKNAREKAFELYRLVTLEGRDPVAEKKKQSNALTVASMAEKYLEEHCKPNKKSWEVDARNLDRDILPIIGHMDPRSVSRADLEHIIDLVAKRGVTTQQNRIFALLSSMFNWAAGRYVDTPPTYGMRKRIREKPRERCLSNEEISILWTYLSNPPIGKSGRPLSVTPTVSLAIKLLMATGQRSSEVSQAEQSEIDLQELIWTIPGQRTKNGKSHRIPLSKIAADVIAEALKIGGNSKYLFPSSSNLFVYGSADQPICKTAMGHSIRKIRLELGMEHFTPHDFRETVATNMMALGVYEQHVAAVLNHSRGGVTARHYARHRFEDEKRKALDLWNVKLQSILNG